MVEYYLVEKGCSQGLWERLILSVNEGKGVRFHRGHNDDKFEIDKDGRLICTTERGIGISYLVTGPLTDEQLKLECDSNSGWSGRERVRPAVRVGGVY